MSPFIFLLAATVSYIYGLVTPSNYNYTHNIFFGETEDVDRIKPPGWYHACVKMALQYSI